MSENNSPVVNKVINAQWKTNNIQTTKTNLKEKDLEYEAFVKQKTEREKQGKKLPAIIRQETDEVRLTMQQKAKTIKEREKQAE